MERVSKLMLYDLLVVVGSVLTLFLIMAVGYVLGKKKLLARETLSQMSTVLLYVVAPALMIDTFLAQERTADTIRSLLIAAAALAGTYALNALLIQPCFRRASADDRGVLRFASIYGNTGFMGIPLIQAVLGQSGMLPAVLCLVVFNTFIWAHGSRIMGGGGSLKKILINPGVVGLVLAVLCFALPTGLPSPVASAVGFIGDLNTPLAMIIIGAQMAEVDLPSLFREGRLYLISAVKLIAIPLVTMLVLLPFRLDPTMYIAIAILAACPVAGSTSLFCQINGKDTSLSARLVSLSTLLSIVTLPLAATAARLLSGLIPT